MTQAELARRVGTSQSTLSAYENGRKEPSVETFWRLLAAAGSRIVVEADRPAINWPSRKQFEHSARELSEVLGLADVLPVRHVPALRYPRLPTGVVS